ncbi:MULTISPECIES: hypothetical protein [unclassified Nostoc]|nr:MULTISPECIES: hypothetical protein [unclassified Nostoc]MDM9582418.1 hypothetical protein [Nostoc sp. GT001]MDZ7944609.1 hypothetical protein [Nostoc sp. EfeVER01]MDZ7993657.1 hypothetical protein [Nostoc sp. EspVER01]
METIAVSHAPKLTFALSQQQTFELRCDYGSHRLDKAEVYGGWFGE